MMTENKPDIFDEYLQEKEMDGKPVLPPALPKWPKCGVTSGKILAALIIVLFFAPIYPNEIGQFKSQFDQLRLKTAKESIHLIYYLVSGLSILLIASETDMSLISFPLPFIENLLNFFSKIASRR